MDKAEFIPDWAIVWAMKTAALLALALALGCSAETPQKPAPAAAEKPATPPPPSVADAKTLIEESAEFSEYQFTNAAYSLLLARSAMNAPALEVANALKSAKLIGFDGDGNVVLTNKAKNDKRFLVRPNGVVDIVPLAKKEMIAVDSVGTGAEPVVELRWRWIPNEIGSAFKTGMLAERYAGEQKARATLLWDGSAWTVLKIEAM